MSRTRETIEKALEGNIPRADVKERQGGGGMTLSYLETWRAIDIANEIFGNLGWSAETKRLDLVGSSDKPAYIATVRVSVANGNETPSVREGTGYGVSKGKNPDYELAAKEAESDALKRALAKFGKRTGLALYDKTQEFVDEVETAQTENKKITDVVDLASKNSSSKIPKPVPTKALIKESFRVLEAQKKITKEDFVKDYLNNIKVDSLDDAVAEQVLNKLKTNFKELSL